jgi:hypothetical protein
MLANVVDIDHTARTVAMQHDHRALIYSIAVRRFPSIVRGFLMEAARRAGLPAHAMQVLHSTTRQ